MNLSTGDGEVEPVIPIKETWVGQRYEPVARPGKNAQAAATVKPKRRAMLFIEVIDSIRNAEAQWTVQDLKSCIFADDLRDCELIEAIVEGVYHNYSLVKDALDRTENTVEDLIAAAFTLIAKYPKSYYLREDREWAIWDVADGYVMDALATDSRICKRAGW